MIELKFRDVDVADLLDIIAQQFDVQVVIASDVSGIKLSSINLSNKTPEAAIQAVVSAAGLQCQKTDDGTFLVGKNLPNNGNTSIAPLGQSGITVPGTVFPGSLPPNNNQGLSQGFDQGTLGNLPNNSLQPLNQWNPNGNGNGNDLDNMPSLVNNDSRNAKMHVQSIALHNIKPSVMAYWIDPANNDVPVEFQVAKDNESNYGRKPLARNALSPADQAAINGNNGGGGVLAVPFNSSLGSNPYTQNGNAEMRANAQFGGGGGGNRGGGGGNNRGGGRNGGRGGAGGVLNLPDGVDRIVAIDPQNSLLVYGTDEGIRELQDTINFLDRPLRQVEIECQFVTVSTSDSRNFGIDFSSAQGNFNANASGFASAPATGAGSFQLGFVRGNFQATLSALLSQNRAKVLTAPRVTAINNLTASLNSTTATPIVLTSVQTNISGNQAQGQNLIYIQTTIGLNVTPTINNDDTITVLMQPELDSQSDSGLAIQAPIITEQTLETIANVKDGDTIALGGLKTKNISRGGDSVPLLSSIPVLGSLFKSRRATDSESELIIFLTARIVHRVGDEDIPVPNT